MRIRSSARHVALAVAIAAAGTCTLGTAGSGAAAPAYAAFVRVNQAGYPIGASKRAYLLTTVAEPGATFRITTAAGHTVLAGAVGPALGRWSARYPHVYAVDFTRLHAAGRYTISVAGAAAAASPPFPVASGARLSRQPLRNSLAFYQDERDGPDFIRTPLRSAPGHLNDEHAMTYLTPKVDGDGDFAGRPAPARGAHRRRRRLVGRRRLPEVRRDDRLHRRGAARGRARLPPADGRARPRPHLRRRGGASAPAGCCGCGTTARARSTTRSGSARATTGRSATTTSGGCRRPTTPTAAGAAPPATSATGRSSAPARPARR